MSYLAIIFIVYALLKGGGNGYSNALNAIKNLDFKTLTPILELFDVDKSIIDALSSADFTDKFDFKTLLPLLTPVISAFINKKQFNNDVANVNYDGLSPVKDVFNDEIYNDLEAYFST